MFEVSDIIKSEDEDFAPHLCLANNKFLNLKTKNVHGGIYDSDDWIVIGHFKFEGELFNTLYTVDDVLNNEVLIKTICCNWHKYCYNYSEANEGQKGVKDE